MNHVLSSAPWEKLIMLEALLISLFGEKRLTGILGRKREEKKGERNLNLTIIWRTVSDNDSKFSKSLRSVWKK